MPSPEFGEVFEASGFMFTGILSEFDWDSSAGDARILTRVVRILISDEDADHLQVRAKIKRTAMGHDFLLKSKKRSGVGFTELDLERLTDKTYESEF